MYRKKSKGWMKHFDFLIINMVCLQVSYIIAYMVRHGFENPYEKRLYAYVAIIMLLTDLLAGASFDAMKHVLKRGYYREFVATLKHVTTVFLIVIVILFVLRIGNEYSRIVLFLTAGIYLVVGYLVRIMWKKYLLRRMENVEKTSLFIVTGNEIAENCIENIKKNNFDLYGIVGVAVVDGTDKKQIGGVPVVSGYENVVDFACREWVDEVFINIPSTEPYPDELIDKLTEMGITIHMNMAKTTKKQGQQQFVEKIGDYTVLTTTINIVTTKQVVIKRAMDIVGGIVGCMITGLLCIIIGPMIYIKSPGPIFFKQERVGRNGKKFYMYKFRSMYMDAEERKQELMEQNRVKDGMMFKLDFDPRIIGAKKLPNGTIKKGIGNFIRDWSLDEFPQFINVLKGDMSMVGTRPPTVDEWNKYEAHHRARLAMKPGVTGLWQVSGRSNITNFEDVVKLDKKYITEWNIGLDIKILLKTLFVVFKKEGSM